MADLPATTTPSLWLHALHQKITRLDINRYLDPNIPYFSLLNLLQENKLLITIEDLQAVSLSHANLPPNFSSHLQPQLDTECTAPISEENQANLIPQEILAWKAVEDI